MRQTLLGVKGASAPPTSDGGSCVAQSAAEGRTDSRKRREASLKQQKFDYFLVYDFEATCERGSQLNPQAAF